MDLTQLANLGEFIGGVAVLVTLVYLATQVRQGAAAQRAATEIAAGGAIQESVNRWSAYRQMIIDENAGAVWAKALRDEELSPTEAVRLRAMVQEMAYSAVATAEIWNSTGQQHLVQALPSYLARELTASETMRQAWEHMSDDLRLFGWEDIAIEVTSRLGGAD
jgi:hypothetical protein